MPVKAPAANRRAKGKTNGDNLGFEEKLWQATAITFSAVHSDLILRQVEYWPDPFPPPPGAPNGARQTLPWPVRVSEKQVLEMLLVSSSSWRGDAKLVAKSAILAASAKHIM